MEDKTTRLAPIDARNRAEAAALAVRPDQAAFIATNAETLEEADAYPWTRPYAIYRGETMVGFCCYGRDPEDGNIWLYRFMIDQRYQGRGLGRGALQALIEHIGAETGGPLLMVGYQPDNVVAERLYHSAGFEPAGMADWGERLARYDYRQRADGSPSGER